MAERRGRPWEPTVPAELEAFCAVEYRRLVGMLALYIGDRHDAEELAQEALLRACRRWEHVSQLESPGGWVRRVALNLANSHLRRQRAGEAARLRLRAVPRVNAPDPVDAVVVRLVVASLPARQKAALILRYYLDLSVEESATHIGVSQDALRSLTKRALAELRTRLPSTCLHSGPPVKEVGSV